MTAKTWLDFVRLPSEISEFERGYLARMNRVALGFLWLNLPVFVCVAFFNETQPLLALVLTCLTLVGPTVAWSTLDNPRTVSLIHGFTAMCMGGLLVHFGQGPIQIEMHFYFFSLLAVLAMFGNPTVIVVAAVTVTLSKSARRRSRTATRICGRLRQRAAGTGDRPSRWKSRPGTLCGGRSGVPFRRADPARVGDSGVRRVRGAARGCLGCPRRRVHADRRSPSSSAEAIGVW